MSAPVVNWAELLATEPEKDQKRRMQMYCFTLACLLKEMGGETHISNRSLRIISRHIERGDKGMMLFRPTLTGVRLVFGETPAKEAP